MGPRGPKEQLDEARAPATTSERLDQLATAAYNFVQTAVAQHPNASTQTLARLVPERVDAYPSRELLKALAWNPNTSVESLAQIAEALAGRLNSGRGNELLFDVGIALFSRFDTPLEILTALFHDEATSTEFRKVIGRQTGRRDVLDLLRGDRSERVRKASQQNDLAG